MRHTPAAILLTACLALAGCSSSGGSDGKPTPTVTVTKSPTLSAAEQEAACVSAWAVVLHENADADQTEDEPGVCAGVAGDHYGMYFKGMMQRNRENQDAMRECLDDPSCTEAPIP